MTNKLLQSIAILLMATTIYAQNSIEGQWKGKTQGGPNGPFEVVYDFKVEGESLKGTVSNPMGTSEIENGKLNGDEFSFDVSVRGRTMSNTGKVVSQRQILVSNNWMEMKLDKVPAGSASGKPYGRGKAKTTEIGYGKVSGSVVDVDSGEPIPFATIALISEEGVAKDGTIADENGNFSMRSIPSGNYKINVSFIGYQELSQNSIVITGKGESYDLGDLSLESVATELDEVVVESDRELIEEKVDRIVYNAEQDETTAGGDAVDVLRRVPLLSVDLDGNVSLRGSSNITVLIDNRPSTISANSIGDALRQIPADQIKSVEVITSPSARYDAEGTGGIINIITKKNNLQGASLNARTSAGIRGSSLGLNAGLRKGRTGLTLGGFGRYGYNIVGEFENDQTLKDIDGNVLSNTTQEAETLNDRLFGRYNLGWDYQLNKYNWVGSNVRFGIRNSGSFQDDRLTQTFQNDNLVNENLQDVNTLNQGTQLDVNLNYIRSFEKKGKEFSILTLYSQDNAVNDFKNVTLDMESRQPDQRIKNINDSYNREFTIQVDYIEPMGENQIMEFGGKNISRLVVSDFTYLFGQANDPLVEVNDAQFSNQFDYTQNVTAGYMSYTVDFLETWSAKLGGRYEYTTIEGLFQDELPLDIPNYGVLVPSINISKKIGEGQTFKIAYNRRIQRPSLRFLNPNIQAANPLDITQGNPVLDPEFTNNYEASYSKFKRGTSVSLSAFVRNTEGSIQPVRESLGQDTVYTTFQNIGEEDAYGLSVFANYRAGKLMLNGGIDAFYAVLDNNVDDPIFNASNSGFVVSGRIFGSYKLTDRWAFQLFSFFRGRRVQLQGYQTGFYVYSLSLNRSFNNEKGSIGFGAENFVTSPLIIRTELNSPVIDQSSANYLYNTNFKINFSYRIGKMSMDPRQRRRRTINNDDMKQGESNNSEYR